MASYPCGHLKARSCQTHRLVAIRVLNASKPQVESSSLELRKYRAVCFIYYLIYNVFRYNVIYAVPVNGVV